MALGKSVLYGARMGLAIAAVPLMVAPARYRKLRSHPDGEPPAVASALATYVHRVLTCRGDTPTLDL
jgi:hypothetical protein